MANDDGLHLLSPAGFAASGVKAGLKASGKRDVGLLVCTADKPASAAVAFSRSTVLAAPITVGRAFLDATGGRLRAVAVNSGNANSCTGDAGEKDARAMSARVAKHLGCDAEEVLPGSTGIIGHRLPMDRLLPGLDAAHAELGATADHADAFAHSILTTDLVMKKAATTVRIGKETVTIAGVCKGSGMIGPMLAVDGVKVPKHATMLAYMTTDVAVTPAALRKLHAPAVERTFNRVTVDNHCSTNDTVVLLASGASGAKLADARAREKFEKALTEVCDSLAYQIAKDGEGATKVAVVRVTKAKNEQQAALLARAIADSPLVKCALHGNDPNWGRIVSMAGMAAARDGLAFNDRACVLELCGTVVFRRGVPAKFDAEALSKAMDAPEVHVELTCNLGDGAAHVYACDLSRDYITINADYHT